MSGQTELEKWAINQFSRLANFGFSEPVLKREHWSTVIDWLGADVGLELELDWRECDAFFLIVRLENSRLPQGYYVSNGKPCWYHLQKIIKERAWRVDVDAMKIISSNGKYGRLQQSNSEYLKQRVLAYKAVLMSCIDQIIIDRAVIFPTD